MKLNSTPYEMKIETIPGNISSSNLILIYDEQNKHHEHSPATETGL